jgi:hypothetical protein
MATTFADMKFQGIANSKWERSIWKFVASVSAPRLSSASIQAAFRRRDGPVSV